MLCPHCCPWAVGGGCHLQHHGGVGGGGLWLLSRRLRPQSKLLGLHPGVGDDWGLRSHAVPGLRGGGCHLQHHCGGVKGGGESVAPFPSHETPNGARLHPGVLHGAMIGAEWQP